MTYDINNIWWYRCLENRQDLSYSAHGFKVTQKFIFMPKNWKTKIWIFPLYFQEFSFINLSGKYVQKCDLSEHFRTLQTQQKCLRIVKNIFSEGAMHFSRIFNSMAPLNGLCARTVLWRGENVSISQVKVEMTKEATMRFAEAEARYEAWVG